MSKSKRRLGEILYKKGFVGKEKLIAAIKKGKKVKKRLGEVLIEDGLATEDQVFEALAKQFGFELVEPLIPAWRVAQLGVGYDDETDRIVVIVQELLEEGEEGEVGRFTISRELANAFAYHALDVVSAGRTQCPFCGEPMEPEGHFCAKTNGHAKSYMQ